jgi:hypothetical protein
MVAMAVGTFNLKFRILKAVSVSVVVHKAVSVSVVVHPVAGIGEFFFICFVFGQGLYNRIQKLDR